MVLTRKAGEEIVIDDRIIVKVFSHGAGRVKIGVDAPQNMPIRRGELPPLPHDKPKVAK